MSDTSGTPGEKENGICYEKFISYEFMFVSFAEGALSVNPPNIINFIKEGSELVSTLDLQNTDSNISISYKVTNIFIFKLSICVF